MKRRLFIGSSKEGLAIAERLKKQIKAQLGEWIEPKIWSEKDIFLLNGSTLHDLLNSARMFEYGVFVATADDITKKRGNTSKTMRDNVLFEAGMFLGSLGLTRAFLLIDSKCDIPSDYSGISLAYYNQDNEDSLDNEINKIIDSIRKTKDSFKLNVIPSTALAVGYFNQFVKVFGEENVRNGISYKLNILVPRNISDIQNKVSVYVIQTKSTHESVSGSGKRPFAYRDQNGEFWDIPTTLSTLYYVIEYIYPCCEVGCNPDKLEWVEHELRNFVGTLRFLISQNSACKNMVSIDFIDD